MATSRIATTEDPFAERNPGHIFDLAEAALDDPDALADFPKNATTVLMPDDDPDLFAANIEIGIAALRRGENVYFRHVGSKPGSPDKSWQPSAIESSHQVTVTGKIQKYKMREQAIAEFDLAAAAAVVTA